MPESLPWLARYIKDSKYFAHYGRVKRDAFVERRPATKASVYTHDNCIDGINWDTGRQVYPQSLKGAGEISRVEVEHLGMAARPAKAAIDPDHHQDIFDQGEDMDSIKAAACRLAESAVYVPCPTIGSYVRPKVSYVVVLGAENELEFLSAFCEKLIGRADQAWECLIFNDGNNGWAHAYNNQLTDHNVEADRYHFRWFNQKPSLGVEATYRRARGLSVCDLLTVHDLKSGVEWKLD